mmetsp:Transcript_11951/g.19297  ORF Transcript_11951/g.19297 Transcript_11951/m.19297 type:complete len:388 (-) Transcript_11951:440-1603(-)|eukprot:CAMPEP_0184671474 /NCGR_PEP_ID=MMETSP0308-20130426/85525_1 /TAXON_ID=38269 /ORGANISM="Gloeochaete witrockiana, Strain SAG 46.84" /LENGTH=387 /DNA_ID=CAMNT_0027118615 /DNA_START=716 /DNA_END=1879 /DNA_ORIENTATION=+
MNASSENTIHPRVKFPGNWVEQRRTQFTKLHPSRFKFHVPEYGVHVKWNSRDHRKGRHPVLRSLVPEKHRFKRGRFHLFGIELANVSWWVAFVFTLACLVWVVNGTFVLFPEIENVYVVGYSALIGGTLFEIGGYLMVVEALNTPHVACFGYAVEKVVENAAEDGLVVFRSLKHRRGYTKGSIQVNNNTDIELSQIELSGCPHDGEAFSGPGPHAVENKIGDDSSKDDACNCSVSKEWRWWGYEFRDMGYTGSFIQFVAATVFWIATISGVPNLIAEDAIALLDVFFWAPQVVGSIGFTVSSYIFMLETQPSWYRIQPKKIGWHVAFWNLIGSIGFLLSGIFGFWEFSPNSSDLIRWGSSFSTFWGSISFLVGSYLQFLEVINRYPN